MIHSLATACALLLASLCVASAQRAQPVPDGVELRRDIPYAGTENPRQKLDLLLPRDRAEGEPLPLVVFVHGGAWRAGNKGSGIGRLMPLVRSGDFAGASVAYRLTGEASWPAQIHDCKAALRWLRANAEDLGIDPDRIGAIGTSAGGHLVSMLGTAGDVPDLEGEIGEHGKQRSAVRCVVNFFGPSELLTMSAHPSRMDHDAPDSPESKLVGGTLQETRDVAREASPISHISAADPPFLHVHGTDDPLVPHAQSVGFDRALREAGIESELHTVDGGGHGGFRDPEIDRKVEAFFRKHLIPEGAE